MEGKIKIIVLKSISYLLSVLFFILGGLIYLVYRTKTLLMFKWCDYLGMRNHVEVLRQYLGHYYKSNDFVLYSLPDGLYVLSYVIMMSTIWDWEFERKIGFILFVPLIVLTSELCQIVGLVSGTFDIYDVLAYLMASIIGMLISVLFKHLKNKWL